MPDNRRALRRLAFMLLALIVLDLFIPAIVRRLEARRYEHGGAFRFENSDLFGLGPLVTYLREHPRSERKRIVFLGNSMVFGYLLRAPQALPALYEAERPGTRVFNMAINGQELGSSYLISKSIIDSVDTIYIQVIGHSANPMMASLIPVDERDRKRFELPAPDPVEHRLEQGVSRVWNLFRSNERIQAALFGTSTRQYLYLHKKDIVRAALSPIYKRAFPEPVWPAASGEPRIVAPRAAQPGLLPKPSEIDQILIDIAELARAHRKRIVFLEFEYHGRPPAPEVAPFNATYAPYAERLVVHIPRTITYDGQHLTPEGGRRVANALARHEANAEAPR